MATDYVELILKVSQLRQFLAGTSAAEKGIKGVGTQAEKTGRKAGRSWQGLAKFAGGATALYGAQRYIRGAVSATEELAKSSLALSRTTGMDLETASQWASVAKVRGLTTKQLQIGFVKLSREMEKSRAATGKETVAMKSLRAQYDAIEKAGGKKAPAALGRLQKAMEAADKKGTAARNTLAQLGVTADTIASGNTQEALNQVADGLASLENPAQRAALAQQLFGRGGQALLPILLKGREGIADQLKTVKDYGAYLRVHSVKELQEMIHHERELKFATQGMRVQLGQALLPVLFAVSKILVTLARVLQPVTKNSYVLWAVIGSLTVAFLAYKTMIIATTIAENLFAKAAARAALALLTNPIFLVVVALVLLGVLLYQLYKRWTWFHKAVDAAWVAVKVGARKMVDAIRGVWSWVKVHWPLLVAILAGPFGVAAYLIIKHFRAIRNAAVGFVRGIKRVFDGLIDFVRNIPSRVAGAVTGRASSLLGFATKHVGGLLHRAQGGPVPRGRTALVGENGPEVVTFPRGGYVTPLAAPDAAIAGAQGGTLGHEVVIPVYLDGREIAKSVARVTASKLARK